MNPKKQKAAVTKALASVDTLEEKADSFEKCRIHKITDLYLEFLAHCDENIEVFEHYLKCAVHHFFTIIFEMKILLNGRLHNKHEELRYADYLESSDQVGCFAGQSFTGSESERSCRLSLLSCDGIQFGVLRKVSNW